MIRFTIQKHEYFSKCIAELEPACARISDVIAGLEWELERNPRLMAEKLSAPDVEWERYARYIGDHEVGWRCVVMWIVRDKTVLLESIHRAD